VRAIRRALRGGLTFRLTLILLITAALGMAVMGLYITRTLETYSTENLKSGLVKEARLVQDDIVSALRKDPSLESGQALAERYGARLKVRVTIIAPDGTVIGDSERTLRDVRKMENHAARPEVAAALAGAIGSDLRHSQTLNVAMLYIAVPINDGQRVSGVLRLALPMTELAAVSASIRTTVAIGALLAAGVALMVGLFLSRRVTRPVAEMQAIATRMAAGDFFHRVPVTGTDEIAELGRGLNLLASRLQEKIQDLEGERAKVATILAEVRRLEHVRTEFVANVSHELRTPLTVIKGYLETLLDEAPAQPETHRRFLEVAYTHAARLSRLVDDLLELSNLETGKAVLKLSAVDVHGAADEIVAMFEKKAAHKKLVVRNETPTGLQAHADRDRLSQVLVNLVDNAVKYTPEGGTVTIGGTRRPDQFVTMWVSDTGSGIPPSDLPRLTERFYRVDKARSRELGGTGLGLAIVKHLVQAHGGELVIESDLGKGTKVSFTLAAG
jgi:signal transduction histidine kinase